MADSKTLKLQLFGTLEWAKVFESNVDRAEWNRETDGEFKVTVHMDEENQAKLKSSPSMKQIKDGKATFGRPNKGKHEWQGGAPKVVDVTGKPWNLETMGLIGNGSTGMVTLSVYPAGSNRWGTRLESVQVVDHIPYVTEGGTSSQFQDLSAMSSNGTPSSKESNVSSDIEDTIPF